jgi:predicted DCC family thiol-disulfide oxidoreductase YuxK
MNMEAVEAVEHDDRHVPAFPYDRPIVVFDGGCVFCPAWVKLAHRFMAARTSIGAALCRHCGDDLVYEIDLLIEDRRACSKSDGTIRMPAGPGGYRRALAGPGTSGYLPSPPERERFIA